MTNDANLLRWEVRQRFTLLEATVLWTGRIIRKDLVKLFNISTIQASKDFTHYQSLCPGNLIYDKSKKCYVSAPGFKPHFLDGSSEEFLHLLHSAPGKEKSPTLVLLGAVPPTELLMPIARKTPFGILQKINRAILDQLEISVNYQSMNREHAVEHQLSPHTIVHNGFRWHVRAYSKSHREFRDFVLARFKSEPVFLGVAVATKKEDDSWNRLVTVQIAAHPGLPPAQAEVIADDYGMTDGVVSKRIRGALVGYFLRLMKIGPDDLKKEPKEQQIILLNREELEPFFYFK
jgi:hypothetical protein